MMRHVERHRARVDEETHQFRFTSREGDFLNRSSLVLVDATRGVASSFTNTYQSRRTLVDGPRRYPAPRIASSISFIAGRPFLRNNPCCLPLQTSLPPHDTVTVIGYLSTRFATTFAFGLTLRIAAFAASNSCIPPSACDARQSCGRLASKCPRATSHSRSRPHPTLARSRGARANEPTPNTTRVVHRRVVAPQL